MGELRTTVFTPVKLENRYIREFVEYYRNLGFTNVILADNNDLNGEKLEEVIADYIKSGFVIVENYRGRRPSRTLQNTVNQELWNKYNQDYDWILVVDADEFLELERPLTSVREFLDLDQFKDADEIRVAWKLYGDAGMLEPVNGDFSLERRFKKANNVAYLTKDGVGKAFLKGHRQVQFTLDCSGCSHHGANIGGIERDVDVLGEPVNHKSHHWKPILTVAWINHYNTKTLYEFIDSKVRRGTMEATDISLQIYQNINRWWTAEQLKDAVENFKIKNNKVIQNIMAINVIVPTYKEPEHLELCIKSALDNATSTANRIFVYVDGTADLEGNRKVIEAYQDRVIFMVAETNRGMCAGMNAAISYAPAGPCLVVNDDHVFPKNWDLEISKYIKPHRILVLNTIERNGSMFKGVERQDFGTCPADFRMSDYLKASYDPALESQMEPGLCRLPFVIDKYEYIALGGWDENCIHGLQADDDFFLKARIVGFETWYVPQLKFYHFSMTTVNNDNLANNGKQKRTDAEQQNMKYLLYKWGGHVLETMGLKSNC